MTQESIETVLAFTIPTYAAVILVEIFVNFYFEKHYYKAADTLTNDRFAFDLITK